MSSKSTAAKNKAIVLEGFETLFNKPAYVAAERFWSPNYVQHSANIAPGCEGLFELVKNLTNTLKYEHDMIMAEGNLVIVHGRFSGFGAPANWIAPDILVREEGVLVEHWDVIQDDATRSQFQEREADVREFIPRIGTSATSTADSRRAIKPQIVSNERSFLCGSCNS